MDVDGEEPEQRRAVGAAVDRRVHHRVVEVLALNGGVIADDDVALEQPLAAIDLEPVPHRGTDRIGDEGRHAAGRLGHQLTGGIHQADGEILVFVDIGAERRARDVGVDLIGDADEAVADHLQRDGIDPPTRFAARFRFHDPHPSPQ